MCLGIPGQIIELTDDGLQMGVVDFGGIRREVRERPYGVAAVAADENQAYIPGQIPQATKVPTDRTAYGTRCTPRHPLGAPKVSAEGICAAFHHAGRR
jgi:hydrogenase expression/formation protein HypD